MVPSKPSSEGDGKTEGQRGWMCYLTCNYGGEQNECRAFASLIFTLGELVRWLPVSILTGVEKLAKRQCARVINSMSLH